MVLGRFRSFLDGFRSFLILISIFLAWSKFLGSVFCLPCILFSSDSKRGRNKFMKLPGFIS